MTEKEIFALLAQVPVVYWFALLAGAYLLCWAANVYRAIVDGSFMEMARK